MPIARLVCHCGSATPLAREPKRFTGRNTTRRNENEHCQCHPSVPQDRPGISGNTGGHQGRTIRHLKGNGGRGVFARNESVRVPDRSPAATNLGAQGDTLGARALWDTAADGGGGAPDWLIISINLIAPEHNANNKILYTLMR